MCEYKLSVITINYNNCKGLKRTIESVVNQTNEDFEFIIIDGGSTDGSVDLINEYENKIDYWVSEADGGIYHAMNKGIAQAHGKYLNFMNSGDCFYEVETLDKVFSEICDQDYIVGIAFVPNEKNKLWKPVKKDFSLLDVYCGGQANHQSSFIKREILKEGYDLKFRIIADELFFVEKIIFQGYTYLPINIIVCEYDCTGISSQSGKIVKQERKRFYREKLSPRIISDYDRFYLTRRVLPSIQKVISVLRGIYMKIRKIR
ncbi:glycosyltransferase family 2 protein [Bacteroides nordii]|uniref:glycosyltransferase family 2 protein n=1 Tax=Bacteroides nordii TaxID=291645 RepID=UPI002088C241|nr:glycosyltransferase family 2 protein [Bacteroides nordii]GFZ42096.1 glycosyl transferase [Bacteroides nordii]